MTPDQLTETAEPCTACRWVFVAVGAAVGLLLLYMAADVASNGAITARIARAPAMLAPVLDLNPEGTKSDESAG